MDHFRVSNYFYCYSSFKRCKSDRRTRWTGYREFGNHRCHIRHSRLSIRTYRLCLLFEHHVYSGNRRVSGFRQCVHRSDDRISMVQRISCPSFHGRYGSLTLGGIIAVFAIIIHKELLIPILCGIFLVEELSVMIQVAYFRFTKRKYGEGKRIFKMTPLHHHFQKPGNAGIIALIQKPFRPVPESKIVVRFVIGIILAVITIVTLKSDKTYIKIIYINE